MLCHPGDILVPERDPVHRAQCLQAFVVHRWHPNFHYRLDYGIADDRQAEDLRRAGRNWHYQTGLLGACRHIDPLVPFEE